MTARLALVFAVVSLGLLAACARNADLVRERADRIEAHYKVTPADARTLAASQVKLDSPEARALFTELTEKLPGFTRLAPEDLEPFLAAVTSTTPQGVRERQEELLSPETIRLVSRIRSELTVPREPGPDGAPSRETVCRYEPRFYEAPLLVALARPAADDASEKERQRLVVAFFHPETLVPLRAVLERAPRARFPVAAIPAACELEGIPTRLVERALDRFRALELDVGVLEINPRVLALLAAVARA
ncbi:hypothetical protein HY251_00720, partial [bacterium]|nr:hypothetical protein [bacterium]